MSIGLADDAGVMPDSAAESAAEACVRAEGGLASLHASLDALDAALDLDDMEAATAVMAAYDQGLRDYFDRHGAEAPLAGVRDLLRMQDRILLRMEGLRRDIAGELGRVRRAGQASRAYAEAAAG